MSELARHRAETCLSDLALDRLLVGELAGTAALDGARGHLEECAVCAARLAELQRQHAELANEVFVAGLVRRTGRRLALPRAGVVAAALAAAAALALVVWPRAEYAPGLRSKGGVGLTLVVRHADGGVEPVLPGETVRPGEAVRFLISSTRPGFVAVVGLDAAGTVTPYVPSQGLAVPVSAGRDQVLPGSIILDETLGAERIFAVLCPDRVPVERVVRAGREGLRRAGGDPRRVERLDEPCEQASMLIDKTRRE